VTGKACKRAAGPAADVVGSTLLFPEAKIALSGFYERCATRSWSALTAGIAMLGQRLLSPNQTPPVRFAKKPM
jgi:hypothetical protein